MMLGIFSSFLCLIFLEFISIVFYLWHAAKNDNGHTAHFGGAIGII
jgi:hypothetical protein